MINTFVDKDEVEKIIELKIRDGLKLPSLTGNEFLEIDNDTDIFYATTVDQITDYVIEKIKKDVDRLPSVDCFSIDVKTGITKISKLIISDLNHVNGILAVDGKGSIFSITSLPKGTTAETYTIGNDSDLIATCRLVNESTKFIKEYIDKQILKIDLLPTYQYIDDCIKNIDKLIKKFPDYNEIVTKDYVDDAVENIKNHVNSKIYGYDLLATLEFVNESVAKIKDYIDRKTIKKESYFLAVKNVSQNNVTGDGTFIGISYGDKKSDVGNDFDGVYYVASADCILEFKIGCMLKIGKGFNSSFIVNLVRYNQENIVQETITLASGLVSNHENEKGNINIFGNVVDMIIYKKDKVFVNVAVFGNNSKNVSLEIGNSQRFSGRLISWL